MDIVIEFRSCKGPGVICDWVNLIVFRRNGRQNCGEGVVGGVGFNNKGLTGDPVGEDWCGSESLFEEIEGIPAFLREIPRSGLFSEASQRNGDIRVIENEMSVKVGKNRGKTGRP